MGLQSAQERQFDDFALVGRFNHTRFWAVLRQRPIQAVTMIIAHIVGGNRERPARMAEQLFWRVLEHLKEQTPGFAAGKRRGPAFRFKMPIHVIDSTTMELVANFLDWAKHRRRKAAAKTHMRLNLQSFLPSFVIVDTVAEHDNKRARELCADLKSGEIALFDKGYVDFGHLRDLDERGVFWVTRAKENMVYEVVRKMPASKDAKILRDEVIVLRNENKPAPELMRQGGGVGQDRWRGTGNDLPDQQLGVESAQRSRPVPLPLHKQKDGTPVNSLEVRHPNISTSCCTSS
jgi:hypothetical protein